MTKAKRIRAVQLRQGNFRVAKLGATRFDLREPYYIAIASPWPVFFLLAFAVLATIVGVFALLYVVRPDAIQGAGNNDLPHALFFSLQVISTAGFGGMSPESTYGYVVAAVERVAGIAILPLVTGILLVRFSRTRPGIIFASTAVVTERSDGPHLMIRAANCKSTVLTGATARLSVLLKETESSGDVWRRYHDLDLVRSRLPLFPLTWTLSHRITESSPLHGLTEEILAERWALLLVSIEAKDARVGHAVESIADYDHQSIQFGKRYASALSHGPDGLTTADLSRLSLVEEDVDALPGDLGTRAAAD